MKILITGATGRIGVVLTNILAKTENEVFVLIRNDSNIDQLKTFNIQYIYGDILDYNSLKKALAGIDRVYHLAGDINISNKHKYFTFDTNINGVKNIIKACKANKVKKLLYTSSIHAFSNHSQEIIDEQTPLCDIEASRGVYDVSKARATRLILNVKKDDLQTVIVCPTGVIGPYDFRPSFFGKGMIESIQNGLKYSIAGAYDYVDVRDVTEGLINAMNKKESGEIYILSGEKMTMVEYIEILKKLTRISTPTVIIPYFLAYVLGFIFNTFKLDSTITPYSVSTLNSNSNISHMKATKSLNYHPRSVIESISDQYKWFLKKKMI